MKAKEIKLGTLITLQKCKREWLNGKIATVVQILDHDLLKCKCEEAIYVIGLNNICYNN